MHVVIPVWLAQVDDSVLRRWYDEPTWRRGREYAMRGNVLDVDVIGSTRITATVVGGGSTTYRSAFRPKSTRKASGMSKLM